MDYQTFNSPQNLPPSFGGQFSTSSAPAHSPQQQLYADPQARLQQSNPSFPYAQFTNGQAGGFPSSMPGSASVSGAMMQPGGLSQNQLHQARGKPPHLPYEVTPPTESPRGAPLPAVDSR